jgi:hypothetical protein
MYIPEEWITRVPPFSNQYIQAALLHEFGHTEGFAQSNCTNASVMSNTNASSYRTSFTDCDNQQFNHYWGVPEGEDPCEYGCPDGYTTTCLGDQQPDECGCCVNYSPIMLDRTGRPRMSSAADGVTFGINSVGSVLKVAWPLSDTTAFLVLDRNGNGTVDNGSELFGNTTRLASGAVASNGYVALADFDVNGDRVIDASDPIYSQLELWSDRNRDGISEPEELTTLEQGGIRGVSTDAKPSAARDRWGNRFAFRARVYYRTGKKPSFSYDVFPVTLKLDGSPSCVKKGQRVSSHEGRPF